MIARHWARITSVGVLILFVLPAAAQQPDKPSGKQSNKQVDAETLHRLAALLKTPQSQLDEAIRQFRNNKAIDPKLANDLKEWLKKNPTLLEDYLKQNPMLPESTIPELLQQIEQGGPNPFTTPPQSGPQPPDFPDRPRPDLPPFKNHFKGMPGKDGWPPRPPAPPTPSTKPSTIPDDLPRNKDYQAAVQLWEQSLGSIEQTPEVKRALIEAFMNSGNSGDVSLVKEGDASFLKELVDGPGGDGSALKSTNASRLFEWLKDATQDADLKMPTLGDGGSGWTTPNVPNNFGTGGFAGGSTSGLGTLGSILAVLVLLGIIAWIVRKSWPSRAGAGGHAGDRSRSWSFDPRLVADRAAVVKAFESLSLSECGGDARVWNHLTIAEALRRQHPEAGELAEPLARLYAIARYSPANEVMTPEEISEARHHLCSLAGVRPA